ncbi:MAG TPA: hypothetical protein DEB39_00410, partial [Planctomycetaceae bacterium]|nr:hypothetical protein [Planctomycetaceae bacterium]
MMKTNPILIGGLGVCLFLATGMLRAQDGPQLTDPVTDDLIDAPNTPRLAPTVSDTPDPGQAVKNMPRLGKQRPMTSRRDA